MINAKNINSNNIFITKNIKYYLIFRIITSIIIANTLPIAAALIIQH